MGREKNDDIDLNVLKECSIGVLLSKRFTLYK